MVWSAFYQKSFKGYFFKVENQLGPSSILSHTGGADSGRSWLLGHSWLPSSSPHRTLSIVHL